MRLRPYLLVLVLSFSLFSLQAQEGSSDLLESDLDSLFDEEVVIEETEEAEKPEVEEDASTTLLEDLTKETGFTFTVKYAFVGAYAPGWSEAPWFWDEEDEEFTQLVGMDIGSQFSTDFQLSPSFRVKQIFSLDFPDYDLEVDQFWGEYNVNDQAYFKIGKQSVKWGLSPNFSYTNLPSRIPEDSTGGDIYAFDMDKPVGIGGFQILALARSGFVDDGDIENLEASDLGYGFKYNLATDGADINIGTFYHSDMNLRGFASLKTTLFEDTEVYAEALVSVDQEEINDPLYSGSIGFADDFFRKKLSLNAEYFYNGERYTYFVEEDDELIEEEESPFVYGHNAALNLYYRPLHGSRIRLFSRMLYNFNENSGKWVPGITSSPLENISLYLAFPMAIGSSDGTYYSSNYDKENRPFSITFAVTLSGNYKFARYK